MQGRLNNFLSRAHVCVGQKPSATSTTLQLLKTVCMNESEFHIRPYSKKELAEFYFPGRSRSATAVTNLRNLMLRNETMMRELLEAGYRPRQRIFTSKLIKIIVYHLGEP